MVSFRISFLIFLTLLISISISTWAQTYHAIITDELIHKICSRTRNPSLCLNYLNSLKQNSRRPNSLAAVGTDSVNMALSHANRTKDMILRRYTALGQQEMKSRYHKCFMIYSLDIIDQLTKANRYMLDEATRSVKECVSTAVKLVDSCSKVLMKSPRDEQSGTILEANNMVKDYGSIVLSICKEVPN